MSGQRPTGGNVLNIATNVDQRRRQRGTTNGASNSTPVIAFIRVSIAGDEGVAPVKVCAHCH